MSVIDVTGAGCQPVRNGEFVSLSVCRISEKQRNLEKGKLSQGNQTKPADVDVMEGRIAWETPLVLFDVQDESYGSALNLMEEDDVFWKKSVKCAL